jgi:hypothetical protein
MRKLGTWVSIMKAKYYSRISLLTRSRFRETRVTHHERGTNFQPAVEKRPVNLEDADICLTQYIVQNTLNLPPQRLVVQVAQLDRSSSCSM